MKTSSKSRPSKPTNSQRLSASMEEQYHQGALHLWRLLRNRSIPAVVFTSATAGEGTSTTVVEIARHLQEGFGLRPLVVRINKSERSTKPRAPSEEDYSSIDLLAMSNGQGLSDVVKPGAHSIPTIIRSDRPSVSKRTMRLQAAITRMLRERQPEYSIVLIDAPPLLESTDTMAICEIVPQVVLVVAAGQTRSEVLDRATHELEEHEVAILGTVLNKHKRVIPDWFYRAFLK